MRSCDGEARRHWSREVEVSDAGRRAEVRGVATNLLTGDGGCQPGGTEDGHDTKA